MGKLASFGIGLVLGIGVVYAYSKFFMKKQKFQLPGIKEKLSTMNVVKLNLKENK